MGVYGGVIREEIQGLENPHRGEHKWRDNEVDEAMLRSRSIHFRPVVEHADWDTNTYLFVALSEEFVQHPPDITPEKTRHSVIYFHF